jgi:DNA-binding protein H-NS
MDFKYLKNSRNLKAFFKGATSKDIDSILEKLTSLYIEVKDLEEKEEKAKKERIEFLSGLLNTLDNHNFTIDDLASLKQAERKENKPKMEPRYCYEDVDGNTCYWSGQGKLPKALKEVMQRDNITDKSFYLIKD